MTTIELARKAGFLAIRGHGLLPHVPEDIFIANVCVTKEINHLVDLVRADEREFPSAPPPAAPVQGPSNYNEFVETACALIKAADDAAADRDYMLDSDDCIAVLRGTWKAPLANDMPKKESTS